MGLKQRLWVNMEWSLVLLLSSVVAADLHHDLQPFKTQMGRLLAINDDLAARVTALESQMTALQSLVTAQQSEVVAVQKEVASVDTHLIQVEDALTNLTVRYNATVGLVEIMESSITTTITKALDVVTRKVRANKKTASGNKDSIKEINKEMTYVKTQVVEFCGYQSSWGKEDKSVTYEYLTVSKNTASGSNSVGCRQGHPPTPRPTPRPTHPPHHKLPGLNTN